MSNMLSNIPNPLDDPTFTEIFEACQARGIIEDDAAEDDYELWQLESWLKEAREEDAAQDHFASFYSY